MTGAFDLMGSLSAAVNAYQEAQNAMVAASKALADENPDPTERERSEDTEEQGNGLPA
jgi:hypothetical protein